MSQNKSESNKGKTSLSLNQLLSSQLCDFLLIDLFNEGNLTTEQESNFQNNFPSDFQVCREILGNPSFCC